MPDTSSPTPAPSSPTTGAASPPDDRFEPLAGLLAVALPGAGHVYLGERSRGLLIAAGVLGLFFGGILIGGIDVVDREEDLPWFVGQALVGPIAFGVDYVHQQHLKVPVEEVMTDARGRQVVVSVRRTPAPGEGRISKSLGRPNELGTLFSTIAGMLNLIAIIDATIHRRRGPSAAAYTPSVLVRGGGA